MKEYDHKKIESKWQKEWDKKKIYQAKFPSKSKKFYSLIEFPYPSGDGLHVGHPRPYIGMDVISRKKRMQGYNVLFPIGWDAFGLPTENYAIKTGLDPRVVTKKNTDTFRRQIKSLGISFDWSREINTTDPKYYKWTQWIFLQFLKKGLAYKAKMAINWCPQDKIGLANEEVVGGACERCGTPVEKREKEQWILAITKYADRLDRDLDTVDYLPHIKLAQRNWIGRSEGAEIDFEILNPTQTLPKGEGGNSLIVHGLMGHPKENWFPWLKENLEKTGWHVSVPALPNPNHPIPEEWSKILRQNFPENGVIVGHSLGVPAVLDLIQKVSKKIDTLVLIAPVNPRQNWDNLKEKFPHADWDACRKFAEINFDWEKIKSLTNKIIIYYSNNDKFISASSVEYYKKNLPKATFKFCPGAGHFNASANILEFPELFEDINFFFPLGRLGGVRGEFGYHTTDPKTWRALQNRVLEMRKNPTLAENKLWQPLRKNLTGVHFRRQHIIGRFVVDFVCLEKSLVVEVDGDIHDYQKKEDQERTDFLKQNGFKVIRFRNDEILKNINSVLEKIRGGLKALPFGEGLGGVFESVKVFTTRPDTIFGATFIALAPEIAKKLTGKDFGIKVDTDRENREKIGINTGLRAKNPANGEIIPVYVVNYVSAEYGVGAIMGVPAHDERDFEFAKKYNLPIRQVICENYPEPKCPILDHAYIGEGHLVNSGKFDGMNSEKAKKEIIKFVEGKEKTTFKLRDWIFSRQRYWGEPIPVIFCPYCAKASAGKENAGWIPVPEKDLPVELPKVKNYQPTDSGESPLANISKWVNVKCPKCKGKAKRETDTMPNWAGSSWYYLRYTDPKNKKEFANKKNLKYWLSPPTPNPFQRKGKNKNSLSLGEGWGGVDWYNGGNEHTTLHLLYSRFWHKFLFDLKLAPTAEPYMKRTSHGMILGEGGVKMSKSLGNVINPDDIVKTYGADTLRLYEMFMGPFDQSVVWSTESIIGARRFLEKIWRIGEKVLKQKNSSGLLHPTGGTFPIQNSFVSKLLHRTIKKVSEDIESMSFNTGISSLMILANEMQKVAAVSASDYKKFLKILSPFAPHLTEELWQTLNEKKLINLSTWPKWDKNLIKEEEMKIAIQINGKVRTEIMIATDDNEETVEKKALIDKVVLKYLAGKNAKRMIYIKNKLINIVV